MHPREIERLLSAVRDGELAVVDALERLRGLPFAELDEAKVDHHRSLRTGHPEVVFAPGKSASHIAALLTDIAARGEPALATRVAPEQARAVGELVPSARYDALSRTLRIDAPERTRIDAAPIAVFSAGTTDLPVAEEAAVTAEVFGHDVVRVTDVGVAGLPRLLAHREVMESASVLVVVAGMDGALPSVVAGLSARPIIAVPTSVGYGASFGGLAALLAMLNSCAPGVTVVNIDNGFGAACAASRIARGAR